MNQPKFINCSPNNGANRLEARLRTELQAGKKVLWLVTGGFNIPISVKILHNLQDAKLNKLTIMLTDERYGQVGHPDSNWQQLQQAGFEPGEATAIPTLQDGLSLEQTAKSFADQATKAFGVADIAIGQIGMGPDGHIFGILPDSPAITDGGAMAVSYKTETFQRVTLSPTAIAKLNAAYVFAYGGAKRKQLEKLQNSSLSVAEQPAQLLKQLPETYIFNDQIGDN